MWGFNASNLGQEDRLRALNKHIERDQSIWLRDHDRFFYISQLKDSKHLIGVQEFDTSNDSTIRSVYADQMELKQGKWIANNAWVVAEQDKQIRSKKIKDKVIDFPFHLNNRSIQSHADLEYYNWVKLRELITYYHSLDYNVRPYEYQLYQQLSTPFIIVLMMLMAIPFVVNSVRMISMNSQVFKGVVIGFGLYFFNVLVGGFAMRLNVYPAVSSVIPALFFIIMFFILLRKRI